MSYSSNYSLSSQGTETITLIIFRDTGQILDPKSLFKQVKSILNQTNIIPRL